MALFIMHTLEDPSQMPATEKPTGLRTAYAPNPLGIDETTPCLRWRVETDRRGAAQTAFRVVVASTADRAAEREGDVWDSGKRSSARPAVEYDGDSLESGERYHWRVRTWDESGATSAWSNTATWEMGLLDEDDWDASWIRRPEERPFSQGRFSYLRKPFSLAGDIERARVFVSASHQYALSVNGHVVDRGQSFSYPDYQYYKTVDVTGELTAGDNVVGAVHTWNGEGQGRPEAEPGFVLQLAVDFADGRTRVVTTDETWRASSTPWVDAPLRNGEIAEPVETIDARRHQPGWDTPAFDDSSWEAVDVAGPHPTAPWERLVSQTRGIERKTVMPESVDRLDSGALVFDFGRIYAGVPRIEFEDGDADRRIELRAGYRLDDDGTVSEDEGTQWTDMRYRYVQRDGAQTFRPFNYLGFRYLQIDDPGEALTTEQVSLIARHNDVPNPTAGTFESSNRVVDDVVELARHSALYGCQEQFVDTPTREKGQFLMDAFNISQVTTRAFGERRLSRQAIDEFVESHYRYWAPSGRLNAVYPNGDGKRDIPDFSESFPEWVWRYYRTTDDEDALDATYPVVRAVADYVVRHVDEQTGLVTNLSGGDGGPYEEGIVDWPHEMRYGYDRSWPARTTVNLLGVNALRRAEAIATELGRPESERAYFRSRSLSLERAIVEHLYDGTLFVDGCDGEDASAHASQRANALALAFGVLPSDADAVECIVDHVVDCGMQMGPMMVPWLLEALDAHDRPEALVDLVTDPEADGWANILAEGGTFTWESWHCRDETMPANERQNRSESHAMGATVFTAIQRTLLGVRFEESAQRTFRIEPPSGGLDAASGCVPTEYGPLHASWRRTDETFELTVTVPWNTVTTLSLPVAPDAQLALDGVSNVRKSNTNDHLLNSTGVQSVDSVDGRVDVVVGAGTYSFVVE